MTTPQPIIILILLILASCSHTPDARLQHAESLMEQHPDSALAILSAITDTFPHSEYDRNVHRVLLTEARYKCFINDTSDSVISLAAKYFDRNPQSPYRTKAYLYKGIILNYKEDFGNAMIVLHDIAEKAGINNDTILLPFIHRAIGDTFDNINNPRSAIEYYRMALDGFKRTGKTGYIPGAVYDVCRTFINLNEPDSCLTLGKESLRHAEELNDTSLFILSSSALAHAFITLNDYQNVISVLERVKTLYPYALSDIDLQHLGVAYIKVGNIIKAKEYEDTLASRKSQLMELSWEIAEGEGDFKKAFYSHKAYSDNNFRIFSTWINRRQEITLLNNYELLKRNTTLEKEKDTLFIGILTLVSILFAGICLTIFLMLRNERLKRSIEMHNAEILREELVGTNLIIDRINEELEKRTSIIKDRDETIANVRSALRESLRSSFSFFDTLAKEYYSAGDSNEIDRNKIFKKINKAIDNLRKENTIKSKTADTVNRHLDGILEKLSKDYPELTDKETSLFMYLVIGLSGKSIGFCLGISDDNVYTRKGALRKKLLAKGTEVAAPYLAFL